MYYQRKSIWLDIRLILSANAKENFIHGLMVSNCLFPFWIYRITMHNHTVILSISSNRIIQFSDNQSLALHNCSHYAEDASFDWKANISSSNSSSEGLRCRWLCYKTVRETVGARGTEREKEGQGEGTNAQQQSVSAFCTIIFDRLSHTVIQTLTDG